MTILVFLQVVFRYLLDAPLDWSEEMASFAFVWMALLGASVGLRNDEHPRLDIFYQVFPDWVKKLSGAALGYSVSYVYVVLPISAVIMFIHVLVKSAMLVFDKSIKGRESL